MINNSKIFYLKERQVNFILRYLPGFNLNNKLLRNIFVIKLSASEQEKLIDELGNLFTSVGLKENDEPNEIGLQVEDLIDIFNPYKG